MKKLVSFLLFAVFAFNAFGQNQYSILFYSGRNNYQDIYFFKKGSAEPFNLTNLTTKDNCPKFSFDGKWIAFISD